MSKGRKDREEEEGVEGKRKGRKGREEKKGREWNRRGKKGEEEEERDKGKGKERLIKLLQHKSILQIRPFIP